MIKLDTLDASVIKALDFFSANKPGKIAIGQKGWTMVIGSGNAYNAGKIIFSDKSALFANESNLKELIKNFSPIIKQGLIKQALIISASGEKDSVWEVELCKKTGMKTTLVTCSPDSSAAKIADKTIAFKKLPEPYTYNVSTYLGMIMGGDGGKAEKIKKWIKNNKLPRNFHQYKSYTFVLPDEYENICPMLDIKRNELFGNHLSIRAFSLGQARHAKFVHPDKGELVISLGKNSIFGLNRWEIKPMPNLTASAVMAITYYLIGLIQRGSTPWFMKHIKQYCLKSGPKAYGQSKPFDIIVPGN